MHPTDAAPELPLVRGTQAPLEGLDMPGCLADATPDSWGRRVILARHLGHLDAQSDTGELSELTYMLRSASDRIGALDFQASPVQYVPRDPGTATLSDLLEAADQLQTGRVLADPLADAIVRGTSVGGARPKAIVTDGDRSLIAKFSTQTDTYPVVKAEAVAMALAAKVGIDVPATWTVNVAGRDVLRVERFDRPGDGSRRQMVSALTMLHLDEMTARYATYPALADLVRTRFTNPRATLRQLFTRIVFNVAVGNSDDHARNHAAFWDGHQLTLTPAYDLCPQARNTGEVAQAMAIGRDGSRASRFATCIAAAGTYLLNDTEAADIVEHVEQSVRDGWDEAASQAQLTGLERRRLWGRQILNPSVYYR